MKFKRLNFALHYSSCGFDTETSVAKVRQSAQRIRALPNMWYGGVRLARSARCAPFALPDRGGGHTEALGAQTDASMSRSTCPASSIDPELSIVFTLTSELTASGTLRASRPRISSTVSRPREARRAASTSGFASI